MEILALGVDPVTFTEHQFYLREWLRNNVHTRAFVRYFLRYEQSKPVALRKTMFFANDKIQALKYKLEF